ncbi:MAG: type II secretion system F family protein, partial [Rickettsiales bacterium]
MQPGQRLELTSLLTPYGLSADDFYVFIAAILAFLTVMLVGNTLIIRNSFASRVKLLKERREALKSEITAPRRRKQKHQETINLIRTIVTKLKLLQKSQSVELAQFLISAGIRNKDAVVVFVFFKLLTPVTFFLLSLLYIPWDFAHPSWKMMIPLLAAYAGMKLPVILIINKRQKRYEAIQKALADTLDLLMICAEAGLSLAQGLERVARELQQTYPEMADELSLTSLELNFQPDRQRTLRNLAQRVQL